MLAVGQQQVGAQRSGREDHASRGEGPGPFGEPGAGALGRDAVAVAAVGCTQRRHVADLVLGQDLHAALLGEPEVVFEQRVLGANAAAHHAGAAACAAGARGAVAAEVGVGHRLAWLAEVHGTGRAGERIFGAEVTRHLSNQLLRGRVKRHGLHAQHALGGVVVRLQQLFPRRQRGPLPAAEERRLGPIQGVGVDDAAATHTRATGCEHILERRQAQDALQAEQRRPEEAAELPGRLGEVLVAVAAPAFEHGDAVALLGQAQRRDTATEAGSDHQPVEVEVAFVHGAGLRFHLFFFTKSAR